MSTSREFCLQFHSLRQARVPWFATTLRLASATNIASPRRRYLSLVLLCRGNDCSVGNQRPSRAVIAQCNTYVH